MSDDGVEERRGWLVDGRVQGVGFRWHTLQEARRLELHGGVWNRADGRVEVHARGPVQALERMEAWLRQGPPAARVEGVVGTEPASEVVGGPGFRVLYPSR